MKYGKEDIKVEQCQAIQLGLSAGFASGALPAPILILHSRSLNISSLREAGNKSLVSLS